MLNIETRAQQKAEIEDAPQVFHPNLRRRGKKISDSRGGGNKQRLSVHVPLLKVFSKQKKENGRGKTCLIMHERCQAELIQTPCGGKAPDMIR